MKLLQLVLIPVLLQCTEATTPPQRLLLLDVDNTLYQETEAGIEAQIVRGTHSYCKDILGIDEERADELYRRYGSTIEGLERTIWKDLPEAELHQRLEHFYRAVYNPVDPSSVLPHNVDAESGSTGYSHAKEERKLARQLLKCSPHGIALASNSPSWHIRKVLQALGLAKLSDNSEAFTPDRLPNFPTKHEPQGFFGSSLDKFKSISFLDDSLYNLERVQQAFPGIVDRLHLIHREQNDGYGEEVMVQALLQEFGLIEPTFSLSQTRYLETKNKVDRRSLHARTWNKVVNDLQGTEGDMWIADVGAGILSMLDLFLHGDSELGLSALALSNSEGKTIHYTAYESNEELYESSHKRLLSWGFTVELVTEEEAEIIDYIKTENGVTLRVKLILRDFANVHKHELLGIPEAMTPNLIVGCCFSDLMDPEQLVPDILRSFGLLTAQKSTLIYFPITFTGTTQFLPPHPFEFKSKQTVPSDTVAFQSYSRALETVLGHNLNHFLLQEAMEDYGANLIDFGSSDWKIDPERDAYLYETMLYFFGSTGGPQLLKEGWDAEGWIQRARTNKPSIQVSNRDLLFSLEPNNLHGNDEDSNKQVEDDMREILFTAPSEVTTVPKEIPSQLGPKQVLVRSSYSLISSGTELKIFKGLFDDDAPLDVNIKDLESERMAYPISYGYCLIGVVVDCGSEVSREDFVGKTIFTFSPHATHVVTDADAVQIVPDGIDPEDAIFMPSIETALSLVHDAHVRTGENIAVYGQGLIGLLVTALLSRGRSDNSNGKFDSITTFDMIPDRLAASSKMGASQALIPGKNSHQLQFDVSIEVSGNSRALQSAIDNTVNGGRVIVGSWYGNKDVSLKLGIDFHRSHKTIQTSQVSEIPANLSQLWTKERRFAYTWDLVKQLKPGQLLTKVLPLERAQEAYEALDNGTELAIAFKYYE